jgi:hypothetical protein
VVIDPVVDGAWVSDEELAAEALAADPDAPLDDDAMPFPLAVTDDDGFALLPDWYMPPARRSRGSRVVASVVLLIVGSLLLSEAFGLCLTYGRVEIPI